MTAVERREPAVPSFMKSILRERAQSAGDEDLGGIVDELRVSIGSPKQQAM